MAEMEKGQRVHFLTRTDYDTNPEYMDKKEYKFVNKYLEKTHSRKADRIPKKLLGSGPDAYLLQEWEVHRGKGAPRVSQVFKDVARHYGRKDEHFLKRKYKERMDVGGIRYASMGKKWSS
jgi:hypothetical protein